MGQYDHWELKLSTKTTNKVAPLVKEWADMLLFANYETILVTDDKSKKQKAQGGQRMMWTSHTTFADAKNRFNLPEKLPFDYSYIAKCIPDGGQVQEIVKSKPIPVSEAPAKPEPPTTKETPQVPAAKPNNPLLDKVYQLMKQNDITEEEIVKAVAMKGYFPDDMKLGDYPDNFIDGVLIGAWDQIKQFIVNNISPFKE